ncbi:MAG: MotA/TolQ/ExbB proton channel family protein, partial [Phycisphaerae bacterium]|nr:MotA/TolQ/ExbB proton channel family protein [Phycisphaerae bacterium]
MWLIAALAVAVVGVACFGQVGPEAEPTTRPDAEKMTLFELLLMGRWFMLPIGLCSLLGLAIVIERLAALRHSAVVPRGFLDGLKRVFRDTRDDRPKALDYCRGRDCPIGRVIAAGIARFSKGQEIVERAMEDAGTAEIQKLRRHLQMLFGVAGASPMLGLLGTVWGMIEAFQTASVKGLGQAEHLATGIYKALVTTFAGLVVAIPALM